MNAWFLPAALMVTEWSAFGAMLVTVSGTWTALLPIVIAKSSTVPPVTLARAGATVAGTVSVDVMPRRSATTGNPAVTVSGRSASAPIVNVPSGPSGDAQV